MDRRRISGIGVLAAAVLALAVGAGIGRPLVSGPAQAAPISSPPRVGDCLYASGRAGIDGITRDDGSWEDYAYGRSYGACREPWVGEVVAVRTRVDMQADLAANRTGPGYDPCAAAAAAYLGRPVPEAVQEWQPWVISGAALDPDQRQRASGQQWQACVLADPLAAAGEPATWNENTGVTETTEPLRGRWSEIDFRNRFGDCQTGPPKSATPVFCGAAHDREVLAWRPWEEPIDAATLLDGCAQQAAVLMQRTEPTAAGALAVDVVVFGTDGSAEVLTPESSRLDALGSASCLVRAADPTQRLTATVIGLQDDPAPVGDR